MGRKIIFREKIYSCIVSIVLIVGLLIPSSISAGKELNQTAEINPQMISTGNLHSQTPQPLDLPDGTINAILDSSNVSLVAQYGGEPRSVVLDGNYAYVGAGNRMTILNILNSPPTIVGQTSLFPDQVLDIAIGTISGTKYAFLAVGTEGMKVVNINTPASPTLVGSGYNPGGTTKAVALATIGTATYAFIAAGTSGAISLNVSTPSAPTVVNTLAASTDVTSIAVSNLGGATTYAYVTDLGGVNRLRSFDVSTTAGVFTAANNDGGVSQSPYDVAITSVGGTYYVLVADDTDFRVFTDNLSTASVSATPTNTRHVFGIGGTAYVSDGSSGDVFKYTINAPPAAPTLVCTYNGSGTAYGLAVDGSGVNIYLAEAGYGIRVITAATCASAAIRYFPNVLDVQVSGNYAYLAAGDAGLQIVDVSTPSSPAAPSSGNYGAETTLLYTKRVSVSSSIAYVTGGTAGANQLRRINVSNPASPSQTHSVNPWTVIPNGVVTSGTLTYVAVDAGGATSGIYVRNAADLTASTSYAAATMASQDMYIGSSSLYVVDGNNGFKVFTLSNIAGGPVAARTYDTVGSALGLKVNSTETYAFVADNNNGLVALNISSSSATTLAGTIGTSGNAKDVAIDSSYAYVAADTGGLRVINISNPASMSTAGFFSTPGNAQRVVVSGNYIYVACGSAGLYILQFTGGSFSISGTVTDTSTSTGLAGVQVSATNTLTLVTYNAPLTGVGGTYTLSGLPAGSYNLSASKSGYTISPSNFSNPLTVGPSTTNKNFDATPTTGSYKISGYIKDSLSVGIQGVLVTNDVTSDVAITNSSGYFELSGFSPGSYNLNAAKSGYTFTPSGWSNPVVITASDVSGRNFTGTVVSGTYSISGTISGAAGCISDVTVVAGSQSVQTTSSGTFYMSLQAGVYHLLAAKSGCTFAPNGWSNPLVLTSNLSGKNFTATSVAGTYTIQGQVRNNLGVGVPGVTITNQDGATTTTNASGYYSWSLSAGSYYLTASGYTAAFINPVTLITNVTGKDFIAVTPTVSYKISGYVRDASNNPIAGVTVSTTAGNPGTSNSSGYYEVTGLTPGSYTLTATKSTYTITPAGWSNPLTITTADLSNKHFTASADSGTYKISGYVRNSPTTPLQDVTVSDGGSRKSTTNASGYYELTNVPAGTYYLVAEKSGYAFSFSAAYPVIVSTADVSNQDFTYTTVSGPYTITGKVTDDGGVGLSGATITSSGGGSATSNASGSYTITGVSAGAFTLTASLPGYTCTPSILAGSAPSDTTNKNFSCKPGAIGPYTISGRVTDSSNMPIVGVTILLNNGMTAMTSGSGNYVISGVPLGTYTIMPSRAGYTFTPTRISTSVSSNITNQNFVGSISAGGTYSVSGKVTTNGVTPLAGVTIYSSNGQSATSDSSGNYTLSNFSSGTFAVMPVSGSYSFSPVYAEVTLSSGTPSATQDFIGSGVPPTPYSINGQVKDGGGNGIAGVTLILSNGMTATTDSGGNFLFTNVPIGSYTIMAFKAGYTFTPAVQTVYVSSMVTINVTVTFTGTTTVSGPYTVSGRITDGVSGVSGVTIYASNGVSTTSDASGNYTLSGFSNGSYTIMPALSGYTFTPAYRSVTVASASVSGQDFTRSGGGGGGTYSIFGSVVDSSSGNPISGALISSGAGHTTYSAADGSYILSGLNSGTYTLSATLSGYTFTTAFSNPVTITNANLSGLTFIGTAGTGGAYTISGRVLEGTNPVAGVIVSDGTRTAITNSSGFYTIINVPYGSYVITPTKEGYSFTPATLSVSVPPNASGKDFQASSQPTYSISGRIVDTSGDPVANVTLTDGAGRTTSSDANGNYTLSGIPAGVYTITPAKAGYTFNPMTITGSVPPNAIDRNFTALPAATYTVSGRVVDSNGDPIADVIIRDANGRTAQTDSNGNYMLHGIPKGNYSLTASKAGYVFSPNPLNGSVPPNATKQNFTGMIGVPTPTPPTITPPGPTPTGSPSPQPSGYVISGTVKDTSNNPLSGVSISDGQGRTTTTDANGNYILSGYVSGSYNITPSKSGYSCTPYTKLVSLPPNATVNFTCSIIYYSVSGKVTDAKNKGIAGVTISAGSGVSTATTASDGSYSLSLPMGSYTLTPSKSQYTFSPTTRIISVTGSLTGQNFYGTTGIVELITNGDFETDAGWVLPYNKAGYSTQEAGDLWAETAGLEGPTDLPSADVEALLKDMAANYTTDEVHSGSRSLRVGIVDASKNVAGYSEARQRVTVSWNCKNCLLRFWLFPTGGKIDNKDIQIVSLLDNNLKQKERLLTMRSNSSKWEFYEFDLTKYRGQTVWLYFGVYNDGKGSVLGMYVDDVSMPCATTDTPPLPPTTPTVPPPIPTVGPIPTNTPSPPGAYTISGRITASNGHPLSGVNVSTSDGFSAVTNANGEYTIQGLSASTYTVIPSLSGASFTPPSITVQLTSSNPSVSGVNFVSSPLTPGSFSISGIVKDANDTPIANAQVIDGFGHKASTNSSGTYTLSGLPAGMYTLSAARVGYVFDPPAQQITLTANETEVNFTGTVVSGGSYTIAGRVVDVNQQPIADVNVSAGSAFNALTNSNGDYAITNLTAGSYVVSPSKSGYTFTPLARVVSLSGLINPTGIDFEGASGNYPTYSISGQVTLGSMGMGGVVVTDGKGHSSTTNSNGHYMLSGLYAGSYTLSAVKTGYSFTPSFSNPVDVTSSNVTEKNFSAAANPTQRSNPDAIKAYRIPASAKPKIDGDFPGSSTDFPSSSQWNMYKVPVQYVVKGKNLLKNQDTYGVYDLKADALFGWDDEYFYVFVKVYDNKYVQELTKTSDFSQLYRYDSVEAAFDFDVSTDFNDKTLNQDDYRIGMAGSTKSPSGNLPARMVWSPASKYGYPSSAWVLNAARSFCEVNPGYQCYVEYTDPSEPDGKRYIDYTGYLLEAAIRWADMGVKPEAGKHYGFAFSVSDNDTPHKDPPTQEKVIATVNNMNLFFDPTTWADLELLP